MFDALRIIGNDGLEVAAIAMQQHNDALKAITWLRLPTGWRAVDSHDTLDLAARALYPGVYGVHHDRQTVKVHRVDFFRDGTLLKCADFSSEPLPLLVVAGHLPWALHRATAELAELAAARAAAEVRA